MVLAQWLSTRLRQCRAPCLEGVQQHDWRNLVSLGEPGDGEALLLANQRKYLKKEKSISSIKVCHWNAEGVSNKTAELTKFLHDSYVSVCCIQETHLQADKSLKIRGYKSIRNDRQGRKKGGVATLVRSNLYAEEVSRLTGEDFLIQLKIVSVSECVSHKRK